MGHNPSRNPFRRARQGADASTQYDLDQYKSRSIWGAWRGMARETRARYFNADEIAWLNRYGSRLDQLSSLAVEHRNEREKHFVGVCLGHQAPRTDRERLWLRAQMVVRYEASLERAAACGDAIRERDAVFAKCRQLQADLDEANRELGGSWAANEMRFSELWQEALDRRRGLRNVDRVLMWAPAMPLLDRPAATPAVAGFCH